MTKEMMVRFVENRRATIVVAWAIMLMAIMLVAGAAIDISRHHSANKQVQYALDVAGLAAARHSRANPGLSASELQQHAQQHFDIQIPSRRGLSLNSLSLSWNTDEDKLNLSVDGTVPTTVMQITGTETLGINTSTQISVDSPSEAEIALVLDMSHSMSTGGRMDALRIAATSLVDTVIPGNESDKVKISIVPFGTYVNVGMDKDGAPWLYVPSNESDTEKVCSNEQTCSIIQETCTNDGIDYSCDKEVCEDVVGSTAPPTCVWYTEHRTWHGCVQSRNQPNDIRDSKNYSGTNKIRGFVSPAADACATPITALTNKSQDLKDAIDALSPRGATYIPAGIMWGARALSDHAPFDEGEDKTVLENRGGFKTIILMSDGANTLYWKDKGHEDIEDEATHPTSHEFHKKAANDRTLDACTHAKDQEVEIYVVSYEISDTETNRLLKDCSSSEDTHFFLAADADELQDAFEKIANAVMRDIAISA